MHAAEFLAEHAVEADLGQPGRQRRGRHSRLLCRSTAGQWVGDLLALALAHVQEQAEAFPLHGDHRAEGPDIAWSVTALILILAFVGVKLLLLSVPPYLNVIGMSKADPIKIDTTVSLLVVVGTLALATVLSLVVPSKPSQTRDSGERNDGR